MSYYQLDFEREINEIEDRIQAAEQAARKSSHAGEGVPALGGVDAPPASQSDDTPAEDPEDLRQLRDTRLGEIYESLTSWDTVRVARHPDRPQTREYIGLLARDFCELHGDRRFGDDPAIVTGFARIGSHKALLVGHQKGKTTQEKLACHFGCAHPEGYRKALAKMQLAEKMGLPIVTFVDTPGAYPGLGAEERGQAEAIAVNLREMSRLRVPIVSIVIGEGGSGGALGIAVADRVAMLKNSWYSVISPEGCAAILWKQANDQTTKDAANALRLTAADNLKFGIVDDVIPESLGGAHRNPAETAETICKWIDTHLTNLQKLDTEDLINARYERFRRLGEVEEAVASDVQSALSENSSDQPNIA